jgi:hypothetical protein
MLPNVDNFRIKETCLPLAPPLSNHPFIGIGDASQKYFCDHNNASSFIE